MIGSAPKYTCPSEARAGQSDCSSLKWSAQWWNDSKNTMASKRRPALSIQKKSSFITSTCTAERRVRSRMSSQKRGAISSAVTVNPSCARASVVLPHPAPDVEHSGAWPKRHVPQQKMRLRPNGRLQPDS